MKKIQKFKVHLTVYTLLSVLSLFFACTGQNKKNVAIFYDLREKTKCTRLNVNNGDDLKKIGYTQLLKHHWEKKGKIYFVDINNEIDKGNDFFSKKLLKKINKKIKKDYVEISARNLGELKYGSGYMIHLYDAIQQKENNGLVYNYVANIKQIFPSYRYNYFYHFYRVCTEDEFNYITNLKYKIGFHGTRKHGLINIIDNQEIKYSTHGDVRNNGTYFGFPVHNSFALQYAVAGMFVAYTADIDTCCKYPNREFLSKYFIPMYFLTLKRNYDIENSKYNKININPKYSKFFINIPIKYRLHKERSILCSYEEDCIKNIEKFEQKLVYLFQQNIDTWYSKNNIPLNKIPNFSKNPEQNMFNDIPTFIECGLDRSEMLVDMQWIIQSPSSGGIYFGKYFHEKLNKNNKKYGKVVSDRIKHDTIYVPYQIKSEKKLGFLLKNKLQNTIYLNPSIPVTDKQRISSLNDLKFDIQSSKIMEYKNYKWSVVKLKDLF